METVKNKKRTETFACTRQNESTWPPVSGFFQMYSNYYRFYFFLAELVLLLSGNEKGE